MPKDISSSSSEDEADRPAPKSPAKQKQEDKTTTRYQCPADFVSFSHKPCSSTLTQSLKNKHNELWLIKTPASFNPECFSSIKVPLSGFETVKVKTGGVQQVYSILSSSHGASDLHLLTSVKKSSDSVVFAPSFSGLINVSESYGDSSANQEPQVIPAAPAPSIPPGLKQRFLPFGSKTPTLTHEAKMEVDGANLVSKRVKDEEEEDEEGKRKKKKKKKDKRIKTEEEEVVSVKEEPVEEMMELEGQEVEEKRKKKKKKKDKEKEEVEEVKVEDVTVKTEPTDTSYTDVVESSGKKKKKKKKSKTDGD